MARKGTTQQSLHLGAGQLRRPGVVDDGETTVVVVAFVVVEDAVDLDEIPAPARALAPAPSPLSPRRAACRAWGWPGARSSPSRSHHPSHLPPHRHRPRIPVVTEQHPPPGRNQAPTGRLHPAQRRGLGHPREFLHARNLPGVRTRQHVRLMGRKLLRPRRRTRHHSVKVRFPIRRHAQGGAGHGLVDRVLFGRGEMRPVVHPLIAVVVVPVLAGLEARDQGMTGGRRMGTRVLRRRSVAAADVTALGAPAQVKPPTRALLAFLAAGATRRRRDVDARRLAHDSSRRRSFPAPRPEPQVTYETRPPRQACWGGTRRPFRKQPPCLSDGDL